jgi:hypothetical protein
MRPLDILRSTKLSAAEPVCICVPMVGSDGKLHPAAVSRLSDSGAHPIGEKSNLSRARKGTTLAPVACRQIRHPARAKTTVYRH